MHSIIFCRIREKSFVSNFVIYVKKTYQFKTVYKDDVMILVL